MATKHQIMLVKTIHRRLKQLLGDNKVTVTVSYTSESDILRITFKAIHRGAAIQVPICTSMKEYLLNPETLQYIVTDALDKMPKPPKWTSMSALFTELCRRRDDYQTYDLQIPYNRHSGSYFSVSFTSHSDATEALYVIAHHTHARNYTFRTSDLDLFESSFERDAGLASSGEYTRWREAGEPKRWTDPTEVRHVVPGRPDIDIRSVEFRREHQNEPVTLTGRAVNNNPAIQSVSGPITWEDTVAMFRTGGSINRASMRYYTIDSLGGSLLNADQLDALRDAGRPTYFAGQPVDVPAPSGNTPF